MRQVLSLLFLLIASSAVQAGHVADHECQIADEEEFFSTVEAKNATVMIASEEALQIIIGIINKDRSSRGVFLVEADKLMIGIFEQENTLYVGVVAFKDRCVVPGTVAVVPASQWVAFTVGNGIEVDDFHELNGG